MIKILFICHGNICRSPMAEFVMKKLVKDAGREDEFLIESAATSREELCNDIYPPARACLKAHCVPFEHRAARQITKADLEKFDYIVAMEGYNLSNLRRIVGDSDKYSLLLDYTPKSGDISDPWYSGDFETVYREIEAGCQGLLETL